jgi:hypothetical protein
MIRTTKHKIKININYKRNTTTVSAHMVQENEIKSFTDEISHFPVQYIAPPSSGFYRENLHGSRRKSALLGGGALVLVILHIVGLRPCGPRLAPLVDAPGGLSVDLRPPIGDKQINKAGSGFRDQCRNSLEAGNYQM